MSTGHVYARQALGVRVSENDGVDPRSKYAATKLEAEHALIEVACARRVPLLIARVFGLIGLGQPPNYVLPNLIRRVLAADIVGVPGLDNVRDYRDTRDVCDGLLRLVSVPADADVAVVNVCSGEGVSIRSLMGVVAEVVAGDVDQTTCSEPRQQLDVRTIFPGLSVIQVGLWS